MFRAFDPYVTILEGLTQAGSAEVSPDAYRRHLDGEAGRQLRSVASLQDLREVGAFFTGERLAADLLAEVPEDARRYADPACGCGDLLLQASGRLPVLSSLEETLRSWAKRLIGRDLVPEFIRATQARLALAALSRGARPLGREINLAVLLPEVKVGDGSKLTVERGDALLLNPPYGQTVVEADCSWSTGRTNRAAVFLDALLDQSGPGVYIAALLPEVLRSGSRYGRFRDQLERRIEISKIASVGLFDDHADVDVFLLSGRTGSKGGKAIWNEAPEGDRVGDICTVRVGAVVANRDPRRGPWHFYLDARDAGGRVRVSPNRKRRFRGSTFDPPFVVVGRTSRPEESNGGRLRPTIVVAEGPVAVENHLIVLTPDDHTIRGCRRLVGSLNSPSAQSFLDRRLRCRHLTVGAVREVPR
jgi:hypothetical protein